MAADRKGQATKNTPADSREALIQAGKRVFAKKGFEGATVKDLSDDAGVNVSLVSYHFGGKEGLYRTCMEGFAFQRLEAAERILRAPGSSEDFKVRLRLFAEDFIDIHQHDKDTCKLIHRGMENMDTVTIDLFKSVFMRVFAAFQGFIEAAQKAGLIEKKLNPEIVAVVMFGSLMHTVRSNEFIKKVGRPCLDDPKFREAWVEQWITGNTEGVLKR